MAKRAELVAEVAGPECMPFAFGFGADAVRLYGAAGGWFARGGAFSEKVMMQASTLAHSWGGRLYLPLATPLDDAQLAALPGLVHSAGKAAVDAVQVEDIGTLRLVKQYAPKLPVHYLLRGYEAGIAGIYAAMELGACRVVLPAEVTLEKLAGLRGAAQRSFELEAPVLGELRAEVPGWHLLAGQPRRALSAKLANGRMMNFEVADDGTGGSAILSPEDLCALPFIDKVLQTGVNAVRLRVFGLGQTASATAACRQALNTATAAPAGGYTLPAFALGELRRIARRPWCAGFYFDDKTFYKPEKHHLPAASWQLVGVVANQQDGRLVGELHSGIRRGQTLEALWPPAQVATWQPGQLWLAGGTPVEALAPEDGGFVLPAPPGVVCPPGTLLWRQG